MKKSKKLGVLLGVLVVACAATYGVMEFEEQKERIKNSDEIILELDADKVTGLSWKYDTEYLSFHKGAAVASDTSEAGDAGEIWFYDEDQAFPVSQEKIADMLGLFKQFGVSFIIEEVEDFGQYGLDDPVCTINIETEEKDYEILLGDFSTMDSERYVSIGDGNVYLVTEDPFETFDATISDMIDHDEIPYFDDVQEVKFEGAENYTLQYEEDSKTTYRKEDMYFVTEVEDSEAGNTGSGSAGGSHAKPGSPLDTVRVDCYLQVLTNLHPDNYVTYNATEEELKKYGLDDPELTVTVQHSWEDKETEEEEEGTFVLHVSRNPEDAKKAEEKAAKAEAAGDEAVEDGEEIPAYVRIGDSQIIYEITEYQYGKVMAASYDHLRHQEILPSAFADIDQIDISLDGSDYTIETEGNSEARKYKYNGEQLEIKTLQTAMEALTASEFTDEKPSDKEEIRLTLHLDLDNEPEIDIAFYRYDGEDCLVTIDGEPVSLVKRSLVMDVVEEVYGIVLE